MSPTEPSLAPDAPAAAARLRRALGLLLIAAASCLVFGRTLAFDFLVPGDDELHITQNPHLLPPSLERAAWFWSQPYGGMYIPLSYDFWMLEAELAGGSSGRPEDLDARVFRAGSIALHVLAGWLVFLLLSRLLGAELPALAGALAFALHPLQVEAVAWISETRGLLAAVLGLAALLVHAGGRGRLRRVASTALVALALLAKPSAAALPLMALGLDVFLLERPWRASLLRLTPWFLAVAALTWVAKRQQPDAVLDAVVPWFQRPWIAADALAFYLEKIVWPAALVPDQGRTPERVLEASALPAIAAAAVLCAALALKLPGRRWFRAALLVFLAGLAPVLGLMPFAHQEISTVASRFAYLAMVALALGLGRIAMLRWGRLRLSWLCLGLIVVWAALSYRQAGTWRDVRTAFERNLELQPLSNQAHSLLGKVLASEDDLEGAWTHHLAALRLGPDTHESQLDLGNVRFQQGRLEEAVEHYRAALAVAPLYVPAQRNLARALILLQRWPEAESQLTALRARDPRDAWAERQLGRARWWQGDLSSAASLLASARKLAPDDAGITLDLAWLRATASAAALRDPDQALALAEGLGPLAPQSECLRLWVLAAANAVRGQIPQGRELAREALRVAVQESRPVLVQRLQAWIAEVESGRTPSDLPPLPDAAPSTQGR